MYVWGQHTEQFGFNLMPSPWSVINSTPSIHPCINVPWPNPSQTCWGVAVGSSAGAFMGKCWCQLGIAFSCVELQMSKPRNFRTISFG